MNTNENETPEPDPLCEAGPPYFDDLELPERTGWPEREPSLKELLREPPYFDDFPELTKRLRDTPDLSRIPRL